MWKENSPRVPVSSAQCTTPCANTAQECIRNTVTLSWKGLPFMNNNIKLLWGLQIIETTYRRNENKYLWKTNALRETPYWPHSERCHLAQGIVLSYTINGTEWLPRMHCGLVPMADIIRQAPICPSRALPYTTQLVLKTTLSASLPVESPRGTITSSHGNSSQLATKLWDPMIVFSTEVEPRALHAWTRLYHWTISLASSYRFQKNGKLWP